MRSAVVVGLDYGGRQPSGAIARYARGDDYHDVMRSMLRDLHAALEGVAGRPFAARPYVDTGPILERELARRAGLGWFGKNTNILHTEEGSYFFLGELLTSLDLESDPPTADHCGTCVRCLDGCPTQALRPGYSLDARRCISYWTIEHRGAIPVEMRAPLGNWIFGCDICQEVCPWNEKLVRGRGAGDTDALLPYLPDLLRLDADAFHRRFRHSAVRRTKRDGFVRNVAIALGNTHNPAAAPGLGETLHHDPAPLVRSHAAWALGEIGAQPAQQLLQQGWRSETDQTVRAEIITALDRF